MPHSSWSSSVPCRNHLRNGRCGWRSVVPVLVALAVFVYSPTCLAGEENSGATPQSAQTAEGQAQGRARPTPHLAEKNLAIAPHVEASQPNSSPLIRQLLSVPERAALAAEIGELLRQGDLPGAQHKLEAALNVGTFAVFIIDQIQDPEVQAALQAIARERQDTRFAEDASAGDVAANVGRPEEPNNALVRERMRAEAAVQELHAVQGQLAASKEDKARIEELKQIIEQEKGRTASARQSLTVMEDQLARMTREAIAAAGARDEYGREVDQAKAALSELNVKLTEAQEQLVSLRTSAAETMELRAVLERERDAAKLAAREIESLKKEIVKLRTAEGSSIGAISSANQEKERADAASLQLQAVSDQLSASREREIKAQDELKQEKERSGLVIRQLVASRREALVLKAQVADAAATQDALRQEKENTAAALRDVSALTRQVAESQGGADFIPATLLFQTTPVLLKPFGTFGESAKPSRGSGTGSKVLQPKARQVSRPPQVEAEQKPVNEAAPQTRQRNLPQKAADKKLDRSPPGNTKPIDMADRNTVVELKRPLRLPTRETRIPQPPAPRLPAALLPADGLWALY